MQYVILHKKQEQMDLFAEETDAEQGANCVITHEQFETLTSYIKEHNPDALLPIQIAYYTGLRLGEVCVLFCKLNDAPFVTLNDAVPV